MPPPSHACQATVPCHCETRDGHRNLGRLSARKHGPSRCAVHPQSAPLSTWLFLLSRFFQTTDGQRVEEQRCKRCGHHCFRVASHGVSSSWVSWRWLTDAAHSLQCVKLQNHTDVNPSSVSLLLRTQLKKICKALINTSGSILIIFLVLYKKDAHVCFFVCLSFICLPRWRRPWWQLIVFRSKVRSKKQNLYSPL